MKLMNNKYLYVILLGILFLGYSCEGYDDLIPSEYDKILSLTVVGEQTLTLYETGEDGNYPISVMKGGNKPNATAEAKIKVMDEVELEIHSQVVGKSYTLLPSNLYEIDNNDVSFTSDEQFKKRNITLKTTLISELLKNSTENYVLPILLYSDRDSINSEKELLMLKPEVVTPVVSYSESSTTLRISGEESTYEFVLELPFESLWDFESTVVVDANSLPSGYDLVPENEITIENGGVISFKKGHKQSEPLRITIKNSDQFGAGFALPLIISDITMTGFEIPSASFMLYAAYNEVALDANMLSTNAQEPSEGPLPNLVDGNTATYFHSAWSVGVSDTHYFQINLKESITVCQFSYINRNNTNGKPQDVTIFVSSNGSDWKELDRIDSGLPTDAASNYTSPKMTSSEPFKYFRFSVNRTNSGNAPTFFSLAEFTLFGM